MTSPRWTPRFVGLKRLIVSVVVAAFAATALTVCGASADEKWTKIDCAGGDAHLLPPSGMTADCFEGPFSQTQGQNYACRLSNYAFGLPPESQGARFYARVKYPRKGGKVCATIPFPDPEKAMQHVNPFVENQATNWSAMQASGDDIELMFFDAKNQKREGKCFTFTKLGPVAGYSGKGHLFTMIGFFCKAPGQPVDAAAAVATINAIQVKTD